MEGRLHENGVMDKEVEKAENFGRTFCVILALRQEVTIIMTASDVRRMFQHHSTPTPGILLWAFELGARVEHTPGV